MSSRVGFEPRLGFLIPSHLPDFGNHLEAYLLNQHMCLRAVNANYGHHNPPSKLGTWLK